MRRRRAFHAASLAVVLLGAAVVSHAADLEVHRMGIRGGISMRPDQVYGGLVIDAGTILASVKLQPSFELGLGNGALIFTSNLDALHRFRSGSWRPYGGGGLGVNLVDVTNGVGEGRGWQIDTALNVVGGIEWGGDQRGASGNHRYVLEGRLGLGDTADFKIGAGFFF